MLIVLPPPPAADEREKPAASDIAKHRKKLGDREKFSTFDRPKTERSWRGTGRRASSSSSKSQREREHSPLGALGSWAVLLVSAAAILYWIVVLLTPKD